MNQQPLFDLEPVTEYAPGKPESKWTDNTSYTIIVNRKPIPAAVIETPKGHWRWETLTGCRRNFAGGGFWGQQDKAAAAAIQYIRTGLT